MESGRVMCAIMPSTGIQGWLCQGAKGWGGAVAQGQDPAKSWVGGNPPWQGPDPGQVCLPSKMTWARAGGSVPLWDCLRCLSVRSGRDNPGDEGFSPLPHGLIAPCPNPGCRAASWLVIKALVLRPSPCLPLTQKLHFHVRGLFLLREGCEDKQWKEGLKNNRYKIGEIQISARWWKERE